MWAKRESKQAMSDERVEFFIFNLFLVWVEVHRHAEACDLGKVRSVIRWIESNLCVTSKRKKTDEKRNEAWGRAGKCSSFGCAANTAKHIARWMPTFPSFSSSKHSNSAARWEMSFSVSLRLLLFHVAPCRDSQTLFRLFSGWMAMES